MADYLSKHYRGWKYRRKVPLDLRQTLGRAMWVKTFPGAVSHDEAKAAARRLAVEHDKLIAGLRKLTPAERVEIWEIGWEVYKALPEALETGLRFVDRVAALEDEPGAADDPESAQVILDARLTARRMRGEVQVARQRLQRITPTGTGIAALIPIWQKINQPSSDKVVHRMQLAVARFVEAVGAKAPSAVTRQDVLTFRDTIEAKYPRPTAVKTLDSIHSLFNAALKNGTLHSNPAHGVKVLSKADHDRRKKPFQAEHVRTIFAAMVVDQNTDFQWVVRLCAWHGMRSGEAAQLRREDITTSMGVPVIRVHGMYGSVKNEASRREVPIHPACMGIVEYAAKAGDPWLFSSFRAWKYGRGAYFQTEANQWLRRIGIEDRALTMHSLRHRFRDLCRELEMPQDVSAALMGHSLGKGEHSAYGIGVSLQKLALWIARVNPLA